MGLVIVQFTHSPGSNAQTSTSIKQVQVPVPRIGKIPTVTYEHLVAPSPPAMSVPTIVRQKTSIQSFGILEMTGRIEIGRKSETKVGLRFFGRGTTTLCFQLEGKLPVFNDTLTRVSSHRMASNREQSGGQKGADSVDSSAADVPAATFLDVAVLRCLFVSQWPEEGVFWALQFLYHRLQDLSEGSISQQQSRRRSNSLPIPKIEVSLYQSPETKKKENKDFIEVPEIKDMNILAEAPFTVQKSVEDKTSHTRRSSEKTKKKMKMADLRAFVETKLLSKSDKALEKIGQLETKSLDDQEYHRSLDTGDDNLTRVCSPLSKLLDPRRPVTNLVKGKSMPSLR
ncbi:Protein unc-80 [Homalodisca vitripennis]|nr:Protein unc-80 [Homalodisca vitripennis]